MKCILLVDDDEPTNFFHRIVLEELEITQNIESAQTAREALKLLECPKIKDCKHPDIIFLDLNMPGMTGWDFIEKFREMGSRCPVNSMIFILTTSVNPDDRKKADAIKEVSGFIPKPLTDEIVRQIVQEFLPN